MNCNELEEHIQHYLEKDLSKRAMLLTGVWGCGKSYYIKTRLKKYLKETGNYSCAIVSLYGVKSLFEISKNIYILNYAQ